MRLGACGELMAVRDMRRLSRFRMYRFAGLPFDCSVRGRPTRAHRKMNELLDQPELDKELLDCPARSQGIEPQTFRQEFGRSIQ
jgi:hypothetical protein